MREKWTEEEMILTLYIYLTHNPEELHKYSDFLNEFCRILNQYTGKNRTPSSIEMRISNYKSIDPAYKKTGLTNGGKSVKEFWDNYHDKIDYMSKLYDKVVNETYIEISDEAINELNEIQEMYKSENVDNKDSYIESTINIRNGAIQKVFKDNLLIEFNQKCALCEINQRNLLIASHILPYSKCKEKTDMINHYNGLLLCPIHDALFDKKMISFDNSGKIIISKSIPENLYSDLNISTNFYIDVKFLTPERIKFMSVHRELMK